MLIFVEFSERSQWEKTYIKKNLLSLKTCSWASNSNFCSELWIFASNIELCIPVRFHVKVLSGIKVHSRQVTIQRIFWTQLVRKKLQKHIVNSSIPHRRRGRVQEVGRRARPGGQHQAAVPKLEVQLHQLHERTEVVNGLSCYWGREDAVAVA